MYSKFLISFYWEQRVVGSVKDYELERHWEAAFYFHFGGHNPTVGQYVKRKSLHRNQLLGTADFNDFSFLIYLVKHDISQA
jgi:hypothetical protein